MRFCPFAQRTILALNAKKIDYEVVNINLADKPDWLNSKSAFGKVPALEIQENVTIYESLVTVEYLDDVYPQRPLLSKDPVKKAFDKIIIEASGPIYQIFSHKLRSSDAINETMLAAYHKALEFIQQQLKSRGTKFLGGSEPGFVDYMIWPWFERILTFKNVDKQIVIDAQKYQLLVEYLESMLKDTAVSQYLVPDDILFQFFDGYKVGNTKRYDFLDDK